MIEFDPGSFKDPAGRVFHHDGAIFRTLSDEARAAFEGARRAGLVDALVEQQLLIESRIVSTSQLGLPTSRLGEYVLEQRRVAMVTYPYEWSFEMLRDAARVTLRVLDRALDAGFILKDATSFNILFDGTMPKLVDAPSIEPYRHGQIWAGYGQFCRCFLFPLLVASCRDIDVQPLLRGTLGELGVRDAAQLMRLRDWIKPGVIKDVLLQARLERAFARTTGVVRSATSAHVYPKAALVASVHRLMRVIDDVRAPTASSEWARYDTFHSYSEEDRQTKLSVVEGILNGGRRRRVADLGCNTGDYSKAALAKGAEVVALDLDSRAIDRLYHDVPKTTHLAPLVANLLNPTPAMGWGLLERRSLLERIRSDSFLALALIHHLRITGGVPLEAIVAQLFEVAPEGVIEWVDKDDSKVRAMLSLRPDVYTDYAWSTFESIVRRHGELVAVHVTHDGRRRLCHVRATSHSRPAPQDPQEIR